MLLDFFCDCEVHLFSTRDNKLTI